MCERERGGTFVCICLIVCVFAFVCLSECVCLSVCMCRKDYLYVCVLPNNMSACVSTGVEYCSRAGVANLPITGVLRFFIGGQKCEKVTSCSENTFFYMMTFRFLLG